MMKGEQMVPVLNALDIQCAVYGNHDFGKIPRKEWCWKFMMLSVPLLHMLTGHKYQSMFFHAQSLLFYPPASVLDFGVAHLERLASEMNFPWLMSNVKCARTGQFLANGKEYHIISKGGRKASLGGINSLGRLE